MSNLNTIAASTAAIDALKNLFPEMDVETTFAEVADEWKKNRAKSEAKAKVYAAAKEPVFTALSSTTPKTAKDIFAEVETDLPDKFSPSKVQWALRNLWGDEVETIDNGKNPKTYRLKPQE
jgi:hypothetical protein